MTPPDPQALSALRAGPAPCDNCGEPWDAHCHKHLVPCCPRYPQHTALPAASPALDVERLARLYMKVRGAHGPNGDVEDHGEPCDWCRLAAEQHVKVARLAAEEQGS